MTALTLRRQAREASSPGGANAPSGPWEQIVRWSLVGAGLMTLLVLFQVASSSANPLDFVQPGAQGPSAAVVQADFPDTPLPNGLGLDGQQYYAVARDPLHLTQTATALDRPHYRLQRILFPLLAWSLHPSGGGTGLVAAFVVVGIVALVLGGVATGALSTALGGPAWPAVAFALLPGAYWSLRVTVADSLALALALAALALSARGRHRGAVLVAVAAVLTKESTLVVLGGWAVAAALAPLAVAPARRASAPSTPTRASVSTRLSGRSVVGALWDRRQALSLAAIPAAVAIGWWAVLRIAVPSADERVDELGFPGVGIIHAATRLWWHHREWWGMASTLGALAVAVVALLVARRHPSPASRRLLGPLLASLGLLLVGNHNVVGMNFGGTRSAHALAVLGIVLVAPRLQLGLPRRARPTSTVAPTVTVHSSPSLSPARPPSLSESPSSSLGVHRVARVVVALLAVQFVVLGLVQAHRDSAAVDEAVDVASGISIVTRHDFRMNPEHGPLPKVLSALPALFVHPVVPDGESWRSGAWFDFTDDFITANRAAGRLDSVLFAARIVPTLIGAACGVLLFVLGRRLFGPVAGAIAGGLWLTAPVFVGFAHFAMIDVPFTAAVLIVALGLDRYRRSPTLRAAALVGGTLAMALLTRHSGLIVAAAVIVTVSLTAGMARREAVVRAGLVALVLFVGVTGFYRLIDPTPPTGAVADNFAGIQSEAASGSLPARLALTVPLPTEWRAGLGYLVMTSDQRPAYLAGQAWVGSKPWFFVGSAIVKLPLTTTALLGGGLIALSAVARAQRRRALYVLGIPAAAVLGSVLFQPLNLGLRYAFAPLALALVAAAGGCVAVFSRLGRPRLSGAGLALLAVAQLAATWSAAPHSLAWTPAPFTPAYRWVTDSNVDFGQDIGAFDDWAATLDAPLHMRILGGRGTVLPITAQRLPDDPSSLTGWVAVSATELTAWSRDQLSWLRAYCSIGTIGGSIVLYRFDVPPTLAAGPTMPAGACGSSSAFSRRVT
jgi:hypothetical protein